jgi:hypothetical protein
MIRSNILAVCHANYEKFSYILDENPYQVRWMFNSELLLICSLIKNTWTKKIIESWRARWHSTKILSEFFKDNQQLIVSIDFDENSKDSKYWREVLKNHKNLKLIHWDANHLIAQNATEPCCVIIDWPKWEDAIILAAELLKNKNIKLICIHDLHKTTFERSIFDILFNNTFCSDDLEYVESFRQLDEECRKVLDTQWEKPYWRNWKKNESYASTIAIIFNSEDPLNEGIYENYKVFYNSNKKVSFAKFISSLFWSNSLIIRILRKINFLFK